MPVTLPPGWLKLFTKPRPTGSSAAENTIGTVVVAFLAASTEGGPPAARITATFIPTSSAASADRRSYWPSAQRYSMATFWPTTKPASASPRRNAPATASDSRCERLLKNPTVGVACWARAIIGRVAAIPSPAMKSRRLIFACPRRWNAEGRSLFLIILLHGLPRDLLDEFCRRLIDVGTVRIADWRAAGQGRE